jgi:hypothetical protein
MARTVLLTPEDPDRGHGPPDAAVGEQALRGLLLGSHARPAGTDLARPAADTDPTRASAGRPAEGGPAGGRERQPYLPVAACCYAVVLYDAASARLVRRIVGMFSDAERAETYARDNGYRLYDVVPATAVTTTAP